MILHSRRAEPPYAADSLAARAIAISSASTCHASPPHRAYIDAETINFCAINDARRFCVSPTPRASTASRSPFRHLCRYDEAGQSSLLRIARRIGRRRAAERAAGDICSFIRQGSWRFADAA